MKRNTEIIVSTLFVSVLAIVAITISVARIYLTISTTNSFPTTLTVLTICVLVSWVYCWIVALRVIKNS